MSCGLGIPSMSLGQASAGHDFYTKLEAARRHGCRGIEISIEDLTAYAASKFPGSTPVEKASPGSYLSAAEEIGRWCRVLNLAIISLQPFRNFEGLIDRSAANQRIGTDLELWIQLAHSLGTDLILVPSNFLPEDRVSADEEHIVADLRRIAELGAKADPVVRFGYEALCWGTRVDTWEKSWEMVKRVGCKNLGLVLDTFNIAGCIWADPAAESGMMPDAEQELEASLDRLVDQVDLKKLFLVQVVDAQRLDSPLVKGHELYNEDQPARMSWSRNCRLFYGEQHHGAYLPVREIAEAIFVKLGYRGWVSFEIFNSRMSERDANLPEELAARGAASWNRLVRDCSLPTLP